MRDGSERDPNRVYYNSGGFHRSRPILTGADAKETFEKIPVIDFSELLSRSLEARQSLAAEVGHAARNVGFFYAKNAPVSHAIIDRAFDVIEKFFGQPDEIKQLIDCNKSNEAKGWQPRQTVGPNGVLRESYSMGNDYSDPEQHHISTAPDGSIPLNQWPDDTLPEFRKAIYDYCKHLLDVHVGQHCTSKLTCSRPRSLPFRQEAHPDLCSGLGTPRDSVGPILPHAPGGYHDAVLPRPSHRLRAHGTALSACRLRRRHSPPAERRAWSAGPECKRHLDPSTTRPIHFCGKHGELRRGVDEWALARHRAQGVWQDRQA